MNSSHNNLNNKPLVIFIGLIASIISILAFITGKDNISKILNQSPVNNNDSPTNVYQKPAFSYTNTVYDIQKSPVASSTPRTIFSGRMLFSTYFNIVISEANGSSYKIGRDDTWPYEEIALSPDYTKIAYMEGLRNSSSDISILTIDGLNHKKLTHNMNAAAPSWSPEGSLIAFSANNSIYTMTPDGNNINLLIENGDNPAWSPDGSNIVFQRFIDQNSEIFIMKRDGTNLQRLTNNNFGDEDPNWSPDGTKIVYVAGGNVCIMGLDGYNLHCYGEGKEPSWSPDGMWIVFSLGVRTFSENYTSLYIAPVDGSSNPILVIRDAGDYPIWIQ